MKERNSKFELLRIILSFCIVLTHIPPFVLTFTYNEPGLIFINSLFASLLRGFGKFGVNTFILISGYFLFTTFSFKSKKVIAVYLKMFFLAIILSSIYFLIGINPINNANIFKMFTPLSSLYWPFMTSYLVIMLIYSFLNKFLMRLNKTNHILVTAILLLFLMFVRLSDANLLFNQIPLFIALYFVGAHIRRFDPLKNIKPVYLFITFALLYLVIAFINLYPFVGDGIHNDSRTWFSHIMLGNTLYTSLASIILSIIFFIAFKNMKDFSSKKINWLAKGTLGTFMIHSYSWPGVRDWKAIGDTSKYLIPIWLGVGIFVFLVAYLVDLIYRETIERGTNALLNKFNEPLSKLDKFLNKYLLKQK